MNKIYPSIKTLLLAFIMGSLYFCWLTDIGTTVAQTADISVTKTDSQTTYIPGQQISYTIVVTNHGPDDVNGVVIKNFLRTPYATTNTYFMASATNGATVSPIGGSDDDNPIAISETMDMPANSTVTFEVRGRSLPDENGDSVSIIELTLPGEVTGNNPDNDSIVDIDTCNIAMPPNIDTHEEFLQAIYASACNGNSMDIISFDGNITTNEIIDTSKTGFIYRIYSPVIIEGNSFTLQRHPSGNYGFFIVDDTDVTIRNLIIKDALDYTILFVWSELTLEQVQFIENASPLGGRLSTVAINRSLFASSGTSGWGASIIDSLDNEMTIINSTFSNNHTQYSESGLGYVGVSGNTLTVINTTFANNNQGIYATDNATVNLKNTIMVNSDFGNCGTETGAVINDLGNNLFDDTTCNGVSSANINLDPTLADNGGNTLTHALLSNSAAIDAAEFVPCTNPAIVNGLDQRGYVRPFDGDSNGAANCDIGAFEFGALPEPPANTNLIFNPGFNYGANGKNGWRDGGSIQSTVTAGVANLRFPTSISGWFHQFRAAYSLPMGLRMVAWVTVSNPDNVAKTFQFVMRDSDLSNTYLCNFTVPPNAPARNYYMRFITATDWEIIRADLRPTVVDSGGLNFDNVNLRYRPWLTFTGKECIPPIFESANLVQNGDFADSENHWSFTGAINHQVIASEKMQLSVTSTSSGWMTQLLGNGLHAPSANLPYQAHLEIRNNSAEERTLQVRFRSTDNANIVICMFTVPGNATWGNYTMRFKTANVWNDMELLIRPQDADGIPLYVDNIDVRYNTLLTVPTTECSSVSSDEAPLPSDSELVGA